MSQDYPPDEQNPYAANPYSAPQSDLAGDNVKAKIGAPNPEARVRFEAIGEAWSMVKEKLGTWMLISLVMLIVSSGIGFAIGAASQIVLVSLGAAMQPGQQMDPGQVMVFIGVQIGQQLLSMLVQTYFLAAMFQTAMKQVRGLPIEVGDLFKASDAWIPMFLGNLLVTLAVVGGALLFILPMFIVIGRVLLVYPLIADARLKATEAFGLSWRALRGHTLSALGFSLVASIVSGIGACLLCVGLLFTMPIYFLSISLVYRDFFLAKPTAGSPWVDPELGPVA